jgi:hypothetical protein
VLYSLTILKPFWIFQFGIKFLMYFSCVQCHSIQQYIVKFKYSQLESGNSLVVRKKVSMFDILAVRLSDKTMRSCWMVVSLWKKFIVCAMYKFAFTRTTFEERTLSINMARPDKRH